MSKEKTKPLDTKKLPSLKKLKVPSYLTLFKGIKVPAHGIHIESHFPCVQIDPVNLTQYKLFFHSEDSVPLSYFYLMAQRAQVKLMLDKKFTLAIPGLIHVSNELKLLEKFHHLKPFEIKAKVDVAYKDTGSSLPLFIVEFWQDSRKIITCESLYLARRKKGSKNKKQAYTETEKEFSGKVIWSVPKNLGKLYGYASDDKNPIHFSDLFAKFVGFKKSILQGWCAVHKVVTLVQKENKIPCNSIRVDFICPIYLPNELIINWDKNSRENVRFQITNPSDNKTILKGILNL